MEGQCCWFQISQMSFSVTNRFQSYCLVKICVIQKTRTCVEGGCGTRKDPMRGTEQRTISPCYSAAHFENVGQHICSRRLMLYF